MKWNERKARLIQLKKHGLRTAVCLLLTLCAAACMLVSHRIAATLQWNETAERWRGSNAQPFAHVSCFLPAEAPVDEDAVLAFRRTVDQKLLEASLEAPENASLYADTYYGAGTVNVEGEHGSSEARAYGVGGNFFLFHPLLLRSGSYISARDLMQDRVVLDEELAWKLFGGVDVAGMSLRIAQRNYVVAGVIARENDFADKLANRDGPGLFLSYEELSLCCDGAGVTGYEIVLPNLIDDFGKGIVTESFPIGDGDVVENSARYTLGSTLAHLKDYGLRSMRSNGVIYPYWENASRLTEDYVALLLIATVLLAIYPVEELLRWLIRLLKKVKNWTKQEIPRRVDERIQERREDAYEAALTAEETAAACAAQSGDAPEEAEPENHEPLSGTEAEESAVR